ncbi:MAG: MCE family protein [Spirochaetes bacterium]|nr:MCE family protein [Spirochaetota bacterium]
MSKLKIEVAVGILFLLGMFILGYFTILMKDEIYDEKDYHHIEVEFPEANGIKKGDSVTILGVHSGQIEDVILEENLVIIKAKIFNKPALYENYTVKIRAEGALGDKYLDIKPGIAFDEERSYAVVDINKRLTGTKSGDLLAAIEDLLAKNENALSDSFNNINDITSNLKETVNNLNNITRDVKDVTAKINRGEGTLGKLLSEDTTLNQADELLAEVKETIEDAREQAPVTSFIRAALTAF